MRCRRTSGVRPIVSRMFLHFMLSAEPRRRSRKCITHPRLVRHYGLLTTRAFPGNRPINNRLSPSYHDCHEGAAKMSGFMLGVVIGCLLGALGTLLLLLVVYSIP